MVYEINAQEDGVIGLPAALADQLGVAAGARVTVEVDGGVARIVPVEIDSDTALGALDRVLGDSRTQAALADAEAADHG